MNRHLLLARDDSAGRSPNVIRDIVIPQQVLMRAELTSLCLHYVCGTKFFPRPVFENSMETRFSVLQNA